MSVGKCCFYMHLFPGTSEHCVGYKAALVHQQKSDCLAQGLFCKFNACLDAGVDLYLFFLFGHSSQIVFSITAASCTDVRLSHHMFAAEINIIAVSVQTVLI